MSSRVGARLRMAMARARGAVGQGEELDPHPPRAQDGDVREKRSAGGARARKRGRPYQALTS